MIQLWVVCLDDTFMLYQVMAELSRGTFPMVTVVSEVSILITAIVGTEGVNETFLFWNVFKEL